MKRILVVILVALAATVAFADADPESQRRYLVEYQKSNSRATLENTVFLRIVRVLPLG